MHLNIRTCRQGIHTADYNDGVCTSTSALADKAYTADYNDGVCTSTVALARHARNLALTNASQALLLCRTAGAGVTHKNTHTHTYTHNYTSTHKHKHTHAHTPRASLLHVFNRRGAEAGVVLARAEENELGEIAEEDEETEALLTALLPLLAPADSSLPSVPPLLLLLYSLS
jgi:hypothetical protein